MTIKIMNSQTQFTEPKLSTEEMKAVALNEVTYQEKYEAACNVIIESLECDPLSKDFMFNNRLICEAIQALKLDQEIIERIFMKLEEWSDDIVASGYDKSLANKSTELLTMGIMAIIGSFMDKGIHSISLYSRKDFNSNSREAIKNMEDKLSRPYLQNRVPYLNYLLANLLSIKNRINPSTDTDKESLIEQAELEDMVA